MGLSGVVQQKSKLFAVRIIGLYKLLKYTRHEHIMSNQVLRSGTSIGANVVEAQYASSDKDFLNKVYIALKECAETRYWLELLYLGQYITEREYNSIESDCVELVKLLTSITKTLKERLK